MRPCPLLFFCLSQTGLNSSSPISFSYLVGSDLLSDHSAAKAFRLSEGSSPTKGFRTRALGSGWSSRTWCQSTDLLEGINSGLVRSSHGFRMVEHVARGLWVAGRSVPARWVGVVWSRDCWWPVVVWQSVRRTRPIGQRHGGGSGVADGHLVYELSGVDGRGIVCSLASCWNWSVEQNSLIDL